jgi:hypothetical protein
MKPYASDLSDAEWAILEPLIPEASPGGELPCLPSSGLRSINLCESRGFRISTSSKQHIAG